MRRSFNAVDEERAREKREAAAEKERQAIASGQSSKELARLAFQVPGPPRACGPRRRPPSGGGKGPCGPGYISYASLYPFITFSYLLQYQVSNFRVIFSNFFES